MTSNDWTSLLQQSQDNLPLMVSDADEDLAVHLFGDDILDIYGDAIDEAAAEQIHNLIPSLECDESTLKGFANLVTFPAISTTHGEITETEPINSSLTKKRKISESTIKSASAIKRRSTRADDDTELNTAKNHHSASTRNDPPAGLKKAFLTVTVALPSSTIPTSLDAGNQEFKNHARAAVTELLHNNHMEAFKESTNKVDTSTAHILALTSDNWVAAGPASGNAPVGEGKTFSRSRRSQIDADERAKQNRERNREHARNTRLRKKAYVDELKKALLEVVAERDANELVKTQSKRRDQEQRDVRFKVIQEFLRLRGRHVTDEAKWSAILEEDIKFVLPTTSYRQMAGEGKGDQQLLVGIQQIMDDAAYVASFLRSLDDKAYIEYMCERQSFMMDGDSGFLEWDAKTVGASSNIKIRGYIRCAFAPDTNKLSSIHMFFDASFFALKAGSAAITVGSTSSVASVSKEDVSIEISTGEDGCEDTAGSVPSTIELINTLVE